MKLKQRWQGLKYWQKGLLWGFISGIVVPLFFMFSGVNPHIRPNFWFIFPICSLVVFGDEFCIKSVFLNPIVYALIGALIGLIIGKVKGR
ncbi:hypothetical protein CMO93_03765 [Candidatus Woesearchaeota archaeon]|nr:hypothetical protein [Candidatus Woesearchaeota archaeon]|tara:strand:- start:896 stop:1165 length:270 start_codon:yes stop_codon:yes gene_type:complete